jgi:hypothetical protein
MGTNDQDLDLLNEALKAYGIAPRYVFSWRPCEGGEIVVVTCGGKKFRHKKGNPALFQLSETDITGEVPDPEMVWDAKLNQRRPKDVGIADDVTTVWDEKLNQRRPVDR